MAHNNKTPASILTAPLRQAKPIISHVLLRDEKDQLTGVTEHEVHTVTGEVNKLTGEYRNPQRAERKARAAAKRARRNKARKSGGK